MPNFREMAKHNCWIAKLNETTKLDKQPYCVGCENEVVDWDVYADMRDEYACRVPVCPHCGLVNYVDSKDMNGGLIVLVFFIGLPILLSYGIISSCNLFYPNIDFDEKGNGQEWIIGISYAISFIIFCITAKFRTSDLGKRMKTIEEKKKGEIEWKS